MIGDDVKAARLKRGMGLPELARKIEEIARSNPDVDAVDRTALLRIESGRTLNPREKTLRSIAIALGESPSFFSQGQIGEDLTTLRIAAAHGIFAAPAIAAALSTSVDGAKFISFGVNSETDGFTPVCSDLSSNGRKRLWRPLPLSEENERECNDAERLGLRVWSNGYNSEVCSAPEIVRKPQRFASGKEVMELWEKNEIDVAVVAADVFFKRFDESVTSDAIHACSLTKTTVRGVDLVAFYRPSILEEWQKSKQHDARETSRLSSHSEDRLFKQSAALLAILDIVSGNEAMKSIVVPASTLASAQILEITKANPNVHMQPFEIPISDYEYFREALFKKAESGVGLAVVWEPFTSALRRDWKRHMKNDSDFESWPMSLALDLAGSIGLPDVSMDVIVRRSYLDKAGGNCDLFDAFLDRVNKVSSNMQKAVDAYRLRPLDDWWERSASDEIRLLARYFGLSVVETLRAAAQMSFELSYTPSYVNYLKLNLRRRTLG